jgi:hypothetical protein
MTANSVTEATTLLDLAIRRLADELPPSITVERSTRTLPSPRGQEPRRVDDLIDIRTQNGQTSLLVEARKAITPRDARGLFPEQLETLATMTNTRFLVVSNWLSPQTRALLDGRGINYVDLTGNTLIRLDSPALYVRTDGATRDPQPGSRAPARLRGAKAGRIVRFLCDVRPPYGIRELAAAANLNAGYLSRLVETLDREALVTRKNRGPIESVDIGRIVTRYAQSYDVFKTNDARTYIAKKGTNDALGRLATIDARTVITGSFAAVRLSPIAAPSLLTVYCDNPDDIATQLDLLPADQGANVALLRPFDPVVWDRTQAADGLQYVAPTQAAIDCLAGNGRMPSEGEALLAWLEANESAWRLSSISELDQ